MQDWRRVLSRGLKNSNTRQSVKLIVIHIYSFALHKLFPFYHIYFSAFASHLEKKIKIPCMHYIKKTQKIVERHPIKIMPIKNLCKERLTPRCLITNPFILIRSMSFCCSCWSFYRMVTGTCTWLSLSHFTRTASSRETQFLDD